MKSEYLAYLLIAILVGKVLFQIWKWSFKKIDKQEQRFFEKMEVEKNNKKMFKMLENLDKTMNEDINDDIKKKGK